VFLDSATDVAAGEGTDPSELVVSAYGDIEVDIGSRRGPRSWDGVAIHSAVVASGSTIVLRSSEDGQVSEGTRVRIIRALLEAEGGGLGVVPTDVVDRVRALSPRFGLLDGLTRRRALSVPC
jgi:hypothetical protein